MDELHFLFSWQAAWWQRCKLVFIRKRAVSLTQHRQPGRHVNVVVDKNDRSMLQANLHAIGMMTAGGLKGMVASADAAQIGGLVRRVALAEIVHPRLFECVGFRN